MTDMTIKAASSQDMRELAERLLSDVATEMQEFGLFGFAHREVAIVAIARALDQAAAQRKGLVEALQSDAIRKVAYSAFYAEKFHADLHRSYEDRGLEIWRKIDAALHPEGKSETSEIEAGT